MIEEKILMVDLLQLLKELNAPIVITKNNKVAAEKNFRPYPRKAGLWLDGDWVGIPTKVSIGSAVVAHFVERKSELWLGLYLGVENIPNTAPRRNRLVLGNVRRFLISDYGWGEFGQVEIDSIFKQNGAVTYSYYLPKVEGSEAALDPKSLEQRFAWVMQRPEQIAFRRAVFAFHGAKCKISGCAVPELLEAAHLPGRDWKAGQNTHLDGIPLRADLHRALDRGLISLNDNFSLSSLDPRLFNDYSKYLNSDYPANS